MSNRQRETKRRNRQKRANVLLRRDHKPRRRVLAYKRRLMLESRRRQRYETGMSFRAALGLLGSAAMRRKLRQQRRT